MSIDVSKMNDLSRTSERSGSVSGEAATQFGDLARELQHEDDLETVLSGIVQAAVELIPGAAHASISLVTGRKKIDSQVASGELPRSVGTETRWPAFSRGAVELGARSMLSIQLFVEGDRLGALNLYGVGPGAFDLESEQIGLLVAAQAAVAFADSQKISQLNEALISRQLIGQAEGTLMERYKITAQQAFLVLTRASSTSNIKLRDVAENLASCGETATAKHPRPS